MRAATDDAELRVAARQMARFLAGDFVAHRYRVEPVEEQSRRATRTTRGARAMYLFITAVQVQPGKVDAVVECYRAAVLPILKRQPGFKGAEVYADYAMNTGGSITRWERPADAQAALTSDAMQAVLARLGSCTPDPPCAVCTRWY